MTTKPDIINKYISKKKEYSNFMEWLGNLNAWLSFNCDSEKAELIQKIEFESALKYSYNFESIMSDLNCIYGDFEKMVSFFLDAEYSTVDDMKNDELLVLCVFERYFELFKSHMLAEVSIGTKRERKKFVREIRKLASLKLPKSKTSKILKNKINNFNNIITCTFILLILFILCVLIAGHVILSLQNILLMPPLIKFVILALTFLAVVSILLYIILKFIIPFLINSLDSSDTFAFETSTADRLHIYSLIAILISALGIFISYFVNSFF